MKQWTEINESCFACNCIPEKYIGLVHPGERELAWVQAKNPRAGRDHSGQSHCKCTDRSKRHWISNMCSYMPGKNIKQRLLHSCSSPCYLKAHTTLCLWKQPADPALHQPGWYKSQYFTLIIHIYACINMDRIQPVNISAFIIPTCYLHTDCRPVRGWGWCSLL